MVTGTGVIDHAETRALIAAATSVPDDEYSSNHNADLERLPTGLTVYGTLEPCPMCACTLTNAGAIRSVSNADDGQLVIENGIPSSDGGIKNC